MIEHKTIEPEDTTTIVMSRDEIDALRRVVDLIAGGECVIQLETDSEPDPEPAWPTAPLVWHAGQVWQQEDDMYASANDVWSEGHMNDGPSNMFRNDARRFAREAVPVTLVPTEAWGTWKRATRDLDYTPDSELIDAMNSLAQEVAR